MKSSKELKNFFKSIAILLITLHTLVLQNFTPAYSTTCNIKCPPRCAAIDYQTCKCLGCPSSNGSTSDTSNCKSLNCPLPPSGCSIINVQKDFNGCPINCGQIICSNNSNGCPIPCAGKCCKTGEICQAINPCKGKLGCYAPLVKQCIPDITSGSGCVLCSLVVPTCKQNEEFFPQTCTSCARCIPRGSDTSGTCKTNCKYPCFGIDKKTCACLPAGCSGNTSGCIECFQVPTCKPNEELVPKTCTTCAYCKLKGSNTSGSVKPFCNNGQITCNSGTPTCRNGQKAICGSSVGLKGLLGGPGCVDRGITSFNHGAAFCLGTLNRVRINEDDESSCNIKKLCPTSRKRLSSCREDKLSCTCSCPFNRKNEKHTPICNEHEVADCPKGLTPTCSNPNNKPSCHEGKLFCSDPETLLIDLVDPVTCK